MYYERQLEVFLWLLWDMSERVNSNSRLMVWQFVKNTQIQLQWCFFEVVRRWDHYSSSFSPGENKVPAWTRCLENESDSDAPLFVPCIRDILTTSWTSRQGWFRWVIPWCFKYPSWQNSGGLRWVRDVEKHDSKGGKKMTL